jgi:hypothetical protein
MNNIMDYNGAQLNIKIMPYKFVFLYAWTQLMV